MYFYQNTPTVLEYAIGGLEFSTNNDKLIFSRYDPSTTPTLPEEIAVWEFTTNPIPNFITSTSNYVRSQIETGLDGKIYTSSATHLAEINLTGTPTVTDIIAINIELNNDLFNCQIRTLPDQISGYTYQATPYDIETYEVNSNANWTPGNGNNPFNATSAISVLQKITIKSGVTLSIEDLTLDFFTNAEVIVEPGATLNLNHATLKSHDCGLMWKGISLQDNGTNGGNLILSNNNQLQSSTLRDAITGITVVGPNTDLIVHGYTLFTANETDIKITNGNKSKIQIHRATFDGGTILRDQTKGSNHGWILDNLFRTTTNIYLIDCNSKIEIGSIGQGGCDFKYAEYGIRAIKSNAISYNNTFLNHMRYGIHGNAQKLSKREVDIYNNIFTEVQQPIRLENWIGSTIQGNQFYTSREFGIDYLENEIIFTTQLEPKNQVGIQTINSNKLNILNNEVNSQMPGDWRNTAILTDDAYWSSIFGNTATGGAGIRIGGNMLTSNVYCNSLNASSTGILLNYCYLRPAGDFHGILIDQSRENNFPGILDVDIRVYHSNKDLNQWVFSGSVPNIDYTYATGTLPNIEGGNGANTCGEGLGEGIGDGQMRIETSPISTKISGNSGQKILNPNLAGTNLTKTSYGKINALKSSISYAKDSLLNTKATHHFASQMAWADFYIQRKKYDSAAYVIKNTIPRDSLEIELNWTYTTLLKLKNSALVLSKLEEERLIEIAQKSQFTQSIAAPLARTLVKQYLHLDIYDKDNFIPSLKGRLISNCNYPNLSNLKVSLMNQSNQLTGISTFTQSDGSFEIIGDKLKNMFLENVYRLSCTLPDSSIIYTSPLNLAAMIISRQVELNCQVQLLKKQEKKEEALSLEIVTIFPNPSNGKIKLLGLEAEQKIYVVNMLGEVVYSGSVTPLNDIDLSYLSKGVYLIKLMNTSEKAFKLVIE